MIFTETELSGAFIIDIEPQSDSRGFFARTFCSRDFSARGLNPEISQASIAFNPKKGTLRGLHFQFPPATETKIVRPTSGAILDVIVDLRPESPTYCKHFALELAAVSHRGLYVPERFAHGYQVLADETEIMYEIGGFYCPISAGGLAYDDPGLGIVWPLPITEISVKDTTWARLDKIEPDLRSGMSL